MRYLVTGASGFVGGRVTRQLVAAGHQVTAVVRQPAKAGDLAELGVQLCRGDITDKESLRAPMTGADGVFHIAGWYKIGVRDKSAALQTNVEGTRHVLEMMRELSIPKGVYTSTLAVNSNTHGKLVDETYRYAGRHLSVYDQTKAQAHALAESFIAQGLPLVIVQPGLVYGPGDTSLTGVTLRQFLQRQLPLLPEKTSFAWGHVDDIARGHVLAMERGTPGENYFICGPAHTLIEAMELAARISGVPLPAMRASPRALAAAAWMMGWVENFMTLPPAYTAEGLRAVAGVTYIGDNGKARRTLGFDPRPLAVGWRETVEAAMQELGLPAR